MGACNRSAGRLRALMCPERGEAAVAPAHARGDLLGYQSFPPLRENAREVLARIERWICRAQRAETRTIAAAVIGDTGGGVVIGWLAAARAAPERRPTRPARPFAAPWPCAAAAPPA